ncbi:MAG: imelysin family protein [Pseudomonadota bacterium]
MLLTHLQSGLVQRGAKLFGSLLIYMVLASCGGGGGGGGAVTPAPTPTPPPGNGGDGDGGDGGDGGGLTGDDARRAVLRDIAEDIILPALQDFDTQAATLQTATETLVASPTDTAALTAAREAWEAAMSSWQRNEVLQVGPAGRSTNPDMVVGGQDFRDFVYSWPVTLDTCALESAALNSAAVNGNTSINITGLGAIEHLLYTDVPPAACADQPSTAQRMEHVQRLADRTGVVATSLLNRWDPAMGDFVEQWSAAGDTSTLYAAPQEALDALSVALFYVERQAKDRKIAFTTGIGATGLTCTNASSCPEFLESPLSSQSGANIRTNVQVFRDLFTGVSDGMGINDLLEGIDRGELATELVEQLDLVLDSINDIESGAGFDEAVRNVADRTDCVNASGNNSGIPVCVLHGLISDAMDTFRGPIVSALGLAIPQSSAGDND